MSRTLLASLHLLLAAATAAAVARAAEDPVSVEVLDEGQAAGRRQLRLALVEGSRSKMTMTMKMGMTMRVDGQALPAADIPPVEFVQSCDVLDVDETGTSRISISCDDCRILAGPGVPQAVVQAMEAAMEGIEGLKGEFRMSDRGIILDGQFDLDAAQGMQPQAKQMIDSMQQSLQQMSTHFPVEPLGVGGKWRTVLNPTVNGIAMQLVTTHTVTELSPKGVTLDITIEQSAEPQNVEAPGVPAGAMRLEKVVGAGAGTTRYEFDTPLPTELTTSTKTAMEMAVEQGGKKMRMETTMNADLTFVGERVESEAPAGAGR